MKPQTGAVLIILLRVTAPTTSLPIQTSRHLVASDKQADGRIRDQRKMLAS